MQVTLLSNGCQNHQPHQEFFKWQEKVDLYSPTIHKHAQLIKPTPFVREIDEVYISSKDEGQARANTHDTKPYKIMKRTVEY